MRVLPDRQRKVVPAQSEDGRGRCVVPCLAVGEEEARTEGLVFSSCDIDGSPGAEMNTADLQLLG